MFFPCIKSIKKKLNLFRQVGRCINDMSNFIGLLRDHFASKTNVEQEILNSILAQRETIYLERKAKLNISLRRIGYRKYEIKGVFGHNIKNSIEFYHKLIKLTSCQFVTKYIKKPLQKVKFIYID